MTVLDPAPAPTVKAMIERVGRASDMHEFERAWTEGLRFFRSPDDRDRILAEAGRRLGAFGDMADDHLRRSWISQVVEEVRTRGQGSLGDGLSSVAVTEMREAFAHVRAELGELRASAAAGEGMHDYAARSPQAAERTRDLGRMAQRLRGSGLMALVSREDAGLARDLAAVMAPGDPLLATVPEWMRVSRDDLLGWTQAEGELPRLVRRLIAETVPSAEGIDMPAGTAVSQPGWDGVVRCSKGNRFVPDGLSVWELSAQKNGSDGKARNDYDKRVENTSDERADAAYVAVMCAPWTKARDFEQEKSKSGDFRLVRTLNVDSLEDWLECTPLTTVWLREQMGRPVAGVGLLSAWWAKWLDSTTVPLEAPVVLAGRDEQAETLRGRCQQRRGGVITIGGHLHRDEILAFVAAVLVASDASGSSAADALYVEERAACQRLLAAEALSSSGRPLPHAPAMTVVVPSADFAGCLPGGSQHRLIVPVPGSSQADIVLEVADSEVVTGLMQAEGKDTNTAYDLGALARMSLLALRRRLAVRPELQRPSWAGSHIDSTLRRCLLLNSWNGIREGDRGVVERFVGGPYDQAVDALRSIDTGDAPMILTDEQWHVVSPADAWTLLSDHITRDDIEAFGEVAYDVVIEPDPFHGMSGGERMRAQYEGVEAKHSRHLRHGVATTLALLGSDPPQPRGASAPFTGAADGIVNRILGAANDDPNPRTWASVARELPLLAEAAPAEVLRGLRTCISGSHAFAKSMFADGDDGSDVGSVFPADSPHLRVIEALEVLAWSPDHLDAVVDVLASLTAVDPGGGWSNRPRSSLASIMCLWSPHTSADADARLNAVEMLRRRHGPVAWDLMLSMLPGSHGFQMNVRGPLYRNWKREQDARNEYWSVVESVGKMLVEDVGKDPDRWKTLVGHVGDLPVSARRALVDALSEIAASSPAEAFTSVVWPELRQTVSRNREFSDTGWALPEGELELFDPILERLQPTAAANVYGWLFSSDLTMVDGKRWADDHEAHRVALAAKRAGVVAGILADGGIDAVLELTEKVDKPYEIGIALATDRSAALDTDVLEAMRDASEPVTVAALTYFESRFGECGWELIDRLIADHAPPEQVVANLLRAVPAVEAPWRRADALGADVADEYWKRVNPLELIRQSSSDQLCEGSARLRKAGRIGAAIHLLSQGVLGHEPEPEIAEAAAACLEDSLDQRDLEDAVPVSRHDVSRLMEMLDRHRELLGTGRVATLEWQCLPALAFAGDTGTPNLHRHLAQDPDLFASLVEIAYKLASWSPGDGPDPDESARQRALNAHRLLHSWPPGAFSPGGDGQQRVNAERLDGWVDHARNRLEETDRQGIGDTLIGAALATSPADSDGEWPSAAVRDLIERVNSDDLDRGLAVAVCNQRGGTTRSPTDGGDQERELAARYRAQCSRFSHWPRTAAIFDSLADTYEDEAGIHDRRAEARRLGL